MRSPNTQYLESLETLLPHYDTFIVDLWGVVHDGVDPYPEAIVCLNRLIASDKQVLFMSNTPRTSSVVSEKLLQFNLNLTEKMLLTSGDVVREHLQRNLKDPNCPIETYYHLGENRNSNILSGINLPVVKTIEEAKHLLISAYADQNEDLDQHDVLLAQAAKRQLPAICSNPDKIILHQNKNRYCAGFFSEKYERLGGKVTYFGKPDLSIYEMAFQRISSPRSKILMIGDTLETDILGAYNAGIDSALVLTGNGTRLLKGGNVTDLGHVFRKQNITPTWVLAALK